MRRIRQLATIIFLGPVAVLALSVMALFDRRKSMLILAESIESARAKCRKV